MAVVPPLQLLYWRFVGGAPDIAAKQQPPLRYQLAGNAAMAPNQKPVG